MKVLVIGGGGREHAICWKLSRNRDIKKIYCVPGNGGIAQIAESPQGLSAADFAGLIRFVKENGVGYTIVGPEIPLVDGIVDAFQEAGLPIFGPNRSAARLEGSKIFSKQLMKKYHIPTAHYEAFSDAAKAHDYIRGLSEQPLVVKADGLAAGKGSIVCAGRASAGQAVDSMLRDKIFAEAGANIIIEECMTGEEVSIFAICDGKDYITLAPTQDFKRALDGDGGKNTGGMGAYAPTVYLSETAHAAAIKNVIEPTLAALQSEGIDYRGVLYCGLMLTPNGPRVVEFNARFGDPETQVVLPLLKTDLLSIVQAVDEQRLGKLRVKHHDGAAACVVLASGGYPDSYQKGKVISIADRLPADVHVFHAGTRQDGDRLITYGGRVMAVSARAATLPAAVEKIYGAVPSIQFDGRHYRTDIARRAITFLEENLMAIDAKEAANIAITYFQELYSGSFAGLMLEELERSDDGQSWLVTLGFVNPARLASFTTSEPGREFKVFQIDAKKGEVVSMRIRRI